jgi:hypothetical protein
VDLTLERKAFPAAPAKPQLQQFRRNCEGPSLVRRMAKPPAPARHPPPRGQSSRSTFCSAIRLPVRLKYENRDPLSVGFCSKPGPPVGDRAVTIQNRRRCE